MATGHGPIPRGDLVPAGIVGLLGTRGPTSRVDISRELGLSPATVTQVTKDLIARGLVEQLESVPSNGGRPARLLGLVQQAGVALGAKVTADHIAIVTVELDGSVRSSTSQPFDPTTPDAAHALGRILAAEVDGLTERLLGVGVGVPGSVDTQASGVVDAPTLGWRAMPIGQTLRERLGTPVLVDNDVNTLAAAERLYGVGRAHSSYLVVTIGRGIGCGIVVDGSVYRGAAGGAGEIGHIPVTADGPVCGCGATGCLEAYIGAAALKGRGVEAFAEAGELLGRVLAGIVHTVDPEVVVLMGEGVDDWQHWEPAFEASLRRCLLPARRGLPVVVEPWTEDQWARGAASLVLASPFDSSGNGGEQGRLVRARLGRSGA